MLAWLKLLWRFPLLFAAVFLLGASCAFIYSYAPLHSSKNWKIDYLEDRVDAQNQQLSALEQELSQARARAQGGPQPEELEEMRGELEQSRTQIAGLEKDIRSSKAANQRLRRSLAQKSESPAAPAAGSTPARGGDAAEAPASQHPSEGEQDSEPASSDAPTDD